MPSQPYGRALLQYHSTGHIQTARYDIRELSTTFTYDTIHTPHEVKLLYLPLLEDMGMTRGPLDVCFSTQLAFPPPRQSAILLAISGARCDHHTVDAKNHTARTTPHDHDHSPTPCALPIVPHRHALLEHSRDRSGAPSSSSHR